jgi:ribonuclease P protein component
MAKGRSIHTAHLSARLITQDTADKSRISVVVSKKVAARAVVRNRLRRRVQAILREFYPALPSSYAVIIFVKAGLAKAKPLELKQEIRNLLSKVFLVEL